MKTRHLWFMFFGVKGLILLASVSFVILHYMVTGADEKNGLNTLDKGFTKLMVAATENDLKKVKDLINKGADLDVQSANMWTRFPSSILGGETALHFACANIDKPGAIDIVAELVNAGANVRIKNKPLGETALHTAVFNSTQMDGRILDLIALLVKNGLDINTQNDDGDTILHYAAGSLHNDDDMGTYLAKGYRSYWVDALRGPRFGRLVNQGIKNMKGRTAEDVSKMTAPNKWKKDLVQPPVLNPWERDGNGFTGLMLAVISGDEDYVKKASTANNALNLQTTGDVYGYTALEEAIMHQRPNMVNLLLEKGANPNVKDLRGNVPLHLIYKIDSPESRRAVIDMLAPKADLNAQDARGNTLLHLAVMHNDVALIKYLLDKYAKRLSLNIANKNTNTPGQLAEKLGYKEIRNIFM